MWEFIRNIINPKVKRPENCICPGEEFRVWSAYYIVECPCHAHHIRDNELGTPPE